MKFSNKTKQIEVTKEVCDDVIITLTGEEAEDLFQGLQNAQGPTANKVWDYLNNLFGTMGKFR